MLRCVVSQRLLLLLPSLVAWDVKVSAETVALCDATTLTKNYQNIGCELGEKSIKMDGLVDSTSLELETGWTCMLRCRSNGVAGYLQCDDEGQWTGNTRCDDRVEVNELIVLRRSKRGFGFRRIFRRIGRGIRRISRGIRRVIRYVLPPWVGGGSREYPAECRLLYWLTLSFVLDHGCCHLMCEPPPQSDDEVHDREPPTITCPVVTSPQYAPIGSDQAVVNFDLPTAEDNDGHTPHIVKTHPLNRGPGSEFPEGDHIVTYMAIDRANNVAYCHVTFSVQVLRCNRPGWPRAGSMSCDDPGVPAAGTWCRFQCDPGYLLSGASEQQCLSNGSWSGQTPSCERVDCGEPVLTPRVDLVFCSAGYKYVSLCHLHCKADFKMAAGIPQQPIIQCSEIGEWTGAHPVCVDAVAPIFTYCPSSVSVYAKRGSSFAVANWTLPVAEDNEDGVIDVEQVSGPSLLSPIREGDIQLVQYRAVDQHQNEARHCSFSIIARNIACISVPSFTNMDISCDSPLTWGATCNFTCRNGYPLVGSPQVTCEWQPGTSPSGFWDYGPSGEPSCDTGLCADLDSPQNGAMTCWNWPAGRFCQMSCNDKWDLPRTVSSNGEYVCSHSDGTWTPDAEAPDCSAARRPGRIGLPSELFYHTGNCSDPAVQEEIRRQFLQQLGQSQYNDICGGPDQCTAVVIDVDCGPLQSSVGRKKKSTYTSTVRIEFKLNMEIIYPQQSFDSSTFLDLLDGLFANMTAIIQASLDSGGFQLSIAGLDTEVVTDSFKYDWGEIECDEGLQPDYTSFSCRACPTGTFYNRSSDKCVECDVGSYQSESASFTCLTCPLGTSTLRPGARSSDMCIAECGAGSYSSSGLIPCSSCAPGTYQPHSSASRCSPCPPGTTSEGNSTSIDACHGFEVRVAGNNMVELLAAQRSAFDNVSLSFWLYVMDPVTSYDDWSDVLISVAGSDVVLEVSHPRDLQISLTSFGVKSSTSTGIDVVSGDWHHIALTIEISSCSLVLFLDGVSTQTVPFISPSTCPLLFDTDFVFQLGSPQNSMLMAVSLTMFSVWRQVLNSSYVSNLASSCITDDSAAWLQWGDIYASQVDTAYVYSPSTCGDGDDCLDDPCNGHLCADKIQDYVCLCENNYTGRNCQTPPFYCESNLCLNGALCVETHIFYECQCAEGYTGTHCEDEIVNGGWGEAETFGPCSVSCGRGTMIGYRRCDSPPQGPGGAPCLGSNTVTDTCVNEPCPECPNLPYQFGSVPNCTDDGNLITCTIGCQSGRAFEFSPAEKYQCGKDTGYAWSHLVGNPKAKLPRCTKMNTPRSMVQTNSFSMELPATQGSVSSMEDQLIQTANSSVCVQHSLCRAEVTTTKLDSPGRRKRSDTSTFQLTITLSAVLEGSSVLSADIYNETLAEEALSEWVFFLLSMETFAADFQDLITNGSLGLSVGGTTYYPLPLSLYQEAHGLCEDTMTIQRGFCVNCPPGKYSEGGYCHLCPTGSFTSDEGQTSCQTCPEEWTTLEEGATDADNCTAVLSVSSTTAAFTVDGHNFKTGLGIGLGVASGGILAMGLTIGILCVIKMRKRKARNRQVSPSPPPYRAESRLSTSGIRMKTVDSHKDEATIKPDLPLSYDEVIPQYRPRRHNAPRRLSDPIDPPMG